MQLRPPSAEAFAELGVAFDVNAPVLPVASTSHTSDGGVTGLREAVMLSQEAHHASKSNAASAQAGSNSGSASAAAAGAASPVGAYSNTQLVSYLHRCT